MQVQRVPIDSLHLDPANARLHAGPNLEAIEASLRRFGQAEPLVVQAKTGRIIGGNGRLVAMKKLGWTECDVVQVDVDDLQATALGIALNRTAELAEWDPKTLSRLLEELRKEDALEGIGYSTEDLDQLLADLAAQEPLRPVEDPGPGTPPECPVTRSGDLWVLGDHRLLCGDSTKPEDFDRVLAGQRVQLVATDPPYLVDYTGERPNNSGKDWSAGYHEVDIQDAERFFRLVFQNVLRVVAPHAALYCWHAHKRQGLLSRIWEELGIIDHQQIVWVKPTAVFSRVYWHFRHEPCSMGWVRGSQPEHDGHHEFNSVWEVDWEGKARVVGNEHPTVKPVELFARPMRKHTQRGDRCLEPFSGSGSQLIAAEQLGRRCYAIEIEPRFCDVALRRWELATGKKARLEPSGQSYKERRVN